MTKELREQDLIGLSIEGKIIHEVFEFTRIFISESEAKKILALIKEGNPPELRALEDEELDKIVLTEDDIAELEQTATIGLSPKDHIQYKQSLEWLCNSRLKEKVTQSQRDYDQKQLK